MGTRGLIGIRYKGKTYYMYNHWDAYPEGLGKALVKEILAMLKAGTLEAFKANMDTILVVHEDDPASLPKCIDLLKTSRVTFDCRALRDFCSISTMSDLRQLFPDVNDVDDATFLNRLETVPVGPTWLAMQTEPPSFDAIDGLVGRSWCNGVLSWSVSSPVGPLERYSRLGFLFPMDIVEGDDNDDHRDLFLEYTYVVDLDRDMFIQDATISIPFSCLTSPAFYLEFIKPFYSDDE